MRNNDILTRDEIRAKIQQAIKDGNTEDFYQSFDQMLECIQTDIQQRADERINQIKQEQDTSVLSARGVRQLTSREKEYYQKVIFAMKEKDPKQALNNVDLVLPETVWMLFLMNCRRLILC